MRPFLLFPILQPLQEHPARPLILSALSYTLTPPEIETPAGEFCFFLLALLVPKCQRSSS